MRIIPPPPRPPVDQVNRQDEAKAELQRSFQFPSWRDPPAGALAAYSIILRALAGGPQR